MADISTKPYMIRALFEWCCDSGFTPYIVVRVDARTQVPRRFVQNNEIVLNVSPSATGPMHMGNDFIEFQARFGGVPENLSIPVGNVIAIYSRENGNGMAFEVEPVPESTARSNNQEIQGRGPSERSATARSDDKTPGRGAEVISLGGARRRQESRSQEQSGRGEAQQRNGGDSKSGDDSAQRDGLAADKDSDSDAVARAPSGAKAGTGRRHSPTGSTERAGLVNCDDASEQFGRIGHGETGENAEHGETRGDGEKAGDGGTVGDAATVGDGGTVGDAGAGGRGEKRGRRGQRGRADGTRHPEHSDGDGNGDRPGPVEQSDADPRANDRLPRDQAGSVVAADDSEAAPVGIVGPDETGPAEPSGWFDDSSRAATSDSVRTREADDSARTKRRTNIGATGTSAPEAGAKSSDDVSNTGGADAGGADAQTTGADNIPPHQAKRLSSHVDAVDASERGAQSEQTFDADGFSGKPDRPDGDSTGSGSSGKRSGRARLTRVK